jgi:alpha-ketoglutarate-dependent taurine dioxygenase
VKDTVTVAAYGSGKGRVVESRAGDTLDALDPREVYRLLAEAGFLLFRGFTTDMNGFNTFVKNASSRIVSDPAREFYGEAAQKVDAGLDGVGLHLENGNSPFMPDLTWFFCQKAASTGSQTTVCDGYRVWDELPVPVRDAFAGQDIVYSRNVPERLWKGLVDHLLGGAKSYDEITVEDANALVTEPDRTVLRPNPDGSIYYAYRTPAVRRPTLFGERPAWANSIFGPSNNYEKPEIRFADGSPLGDELLTAAERVSDSVTEDIDWQDGDAVVIDNTRVMHGRRPIEDPARTIFNAQSYAEPTYLAAAA